ncbi:MAG: histidine kinase [Acidimicrobiia bacterium]
METVDTDQQHPHGVARVDLLVAGLTLLLNASTAAFTATKHGEPPFTIPALAVLTVGALGLVWRRRLPVTTLAVVGIAAALYGAADWPDPLIPFGVFVALATVFEFSSPPVKWSAWAITVLAASIGTALIADSDALDWWTAALVVTGAPLVGDYLRARRRLFVAVTARIHRLEAERLRALDDARAAERTRVARELHDVVAHHVTMLVVQAEAAASEPALAGTATQSAFDDLARSGRDAMIELRRLLGVLRSGESPALIAPRPTLRDLDALVTDVDAAGATVTVQVNGPVDTLPTAVDLAAFRIVQEGLTNVVKHAPGSKAAVTITPTDRDLAILITNTPTPRGGATPGLSNHGVGLIGLHERAELLGGTLTSGPGPLGGFRLEAHLPLDTA